MAQVGLCGGNHDFLRVETMGSPGRVEPDMIVTLVEGRQSVELEGMKVQGNPHSRRNGEAENHISERGTCNAANRFASEWMHLTSQDH